MPSQKPEQAALKIYHHGSPVALSRRVPVLENIGFRVISERTFEVGDDGRRRRSSSTTWNWRTRSASRSTSPMAARCSRRSSCRSGAARPTMTATTRLAQTAGLCVARDRHPARLWPLSAAGRHPAEPGFHRRGAQPLSRHRARRCIALFVARLDPAAETEGEVDRQAPQGQDQGRAGGRAQHRRRHHHPPLPQPDRSVAAHQPFRRRDEGDEASRWRSSSIAQRSTACRSRGRGARSSSTVRRSRACICASARWRAAACAGRTAPRITAPRCSAWSRRSRSRTPSSCRSAPRAASSRSACRPAAAATRSSRPARQAYINFVSSLLSITDNIDGDGVVPPADMVRRDGDDPYFVVAADKGTATFSDTANAISAEARLLARRRLRLAAARPATTTRRWASPPRAPGKR